MAISQPIKNIEVIKKIKEYYKQKNMLQDLLLFELGINTGANLKDLLQLRIKDIKNKAYIAFDGDKVFPVSSEIQNIISKIADNKDPSEFLFQNKSGNRINRSVVFTSFKEICSELGLPKDISVASWRKTFAFHHYKKYRDLSYLQWLFNQTTVKITLKFIGVYENMNLRYREGVLL